jgi:hypothetical protein
MLSANTLRPPFDDALMPEAAESTYKKQEVKTPFRGRPKSLDFLRGIHSLGSARPCASELADPTAASTSEAERLARAATPVYVYGSVA